MKEKLRDRCADCGHTQMGLRNTSCARCKSENIIQITEEQFQRERAERAANSVNTDSRGPQEDLTAEVRVIELLTLDHHPTKTVQEVKGLAITVASGSRVFDLKAQEKLHISLTDQASNALRKKAQLMGGNCVLGLSLSVNTDDPPGKLAPSVQTVVAIGTVVVVE